MRIAVFAAVSVLVVACGGSSDATVEVLKSFGSVQCSGGGTTLSALEAQLTGAGIAVLRSSCGADGVLHPTLCGSPDGLVGIFDVSEAQLAAAEALQFAPLSTVPNAVRLACP
jgi:hypothetical protein